MRKYENLTVDEIKDKIRPRRRVENSVPKKVKKELVKELILRDKTGEVRDEIMREVLYDLLPPAPQGREEIEKLQIELSKTFVSKEMVSKFEDELETWRWITDERLLLSFKNAVQAHSDPENIGFARVLLYEILNRKIENQVSQHTYYDFIRSQVPRTNNPLFRKKIEEMLIIISS